MSFSEFTQKDYEVIARNYADLKEAARKRCAGEQELAVVQKAFDFANEAHKNVRRRSGEPYILHPIAVAKIVVNDIGLGYKSIAAALLHDVVEDTPTTLDDLTAAFGPERSITLCRELTKLHEEITKTTIGEAVRYYEQNDPRGEYVLVMAGAPAAQAAAEEVTLPDAVATARLLMAQGTPPAAAAKQAAKGTPFSKGDIYKELIAAKDEDDREEESE